MKIDISRLYQPTDRNTITIVLNHEFVKEMGFEPNFYVQVIYEPGKITIVKEVEVKKD
jgi:hypothetical protein